ncbi:MAG: hypothetical protein GY719_14315 [bacterium]|nr:hypothetical protein [bacterium]
MSGDQRGDFSRLTFDPARRYSSVRMQQGRVQLDSDWNELVDILAHRLRSHARDLVGAAGAPAEGSGFAIQPRAALRFNGDDQYVSLGYGPVDLFAAPEALTVEMWVRPEVESSGGTILSRFDRRAQDSSARHTYLLDLLSDGGLRLHHARAGGEIALAGRGIEPGSWGHVALAHDAEQCHLFVDGEAAGSLPSGLEAEGGGAVFLVGLAHLHGERLGFDGSIREVRIWNRVLEASELRRDLGDGESEQEASLIGHWRFDALEDQVVPDLSGHGHHALPGGGHEEASPTLELEDLLVGAGRYYSGGVLCENPETVPFASQPDLPGADLPADREAGRAYLFYLDVWERSVSAAQDEGLREVALGGADTACRTQVVAQARWRPIDLDHMPEDPLWLPPEWRSLERRGEGSPRLRARRGESAPGVLENRLYRLEVHGGGAPYGWPRAPVEPDAALAVAHLSSAAQEITLEEDGVVGAGIGRGDWVELYSSETDDREEAGLLARVHRADAEENALILDRPIDNYEDHHELRLRRVATFKWSRENASIELPIAHLEEGGRVVTLRDTGRGELPLSAGDWLEFVDDRSSLGDDAGPLARVQSVETSSRTVTLSRPPTGGVGLDRELHPLIRRWDQRSSGDQQLAGGVLAAETGTWLRLENGIEVFFDGSGSLAGGEYWTFAARQNSGEINWPTDAAGEPLTQPPQGIEHHLSPLALLRFTEGGFELRDCRPVFQPLATGAVSKAGDRMRGRLEIRADPEEGPGLDVTGAIRGETLLGELGSPSAVGNVNLADMVVTRSKIATDVGTVDAGYSILGDRSEPPQGYEYTGCPLQVPNPHPEWVPRGQARLTEEPGEMHSAAVGGRVYTFSETGSVWSYDSHSHELSECRAMPEPRRCFALAAVGGKIFLFGGLDHQDRKIATTLEYDPASDEWRAAADMPTPRSEVAVAVKGGRIHVLGGLQDFLFFEIVSRRNEVYDPRIDAWSRRRRLPSARFALSAAAGPKGIYALGGERRWFFRWLGRGLSAVSEEYLPGVDRWLRRRTLLPAPQSRGGTARIGDKIFLVGGRSLFGWTAETAEFTPESDVWEPARSLPVPAVTPGVAAVDGRLIVNTVGADPESLLVQECTIYTTFYVHRKSPAPEAEIEPQLRLDEDEVEDLAPPPVPD